MWIEIDESHSGNFQLGLSDQNFALLVAAIATGWPYVEERMMKFSENCSAPDQWICPYADLSFNR
jgi:hypothetical protein